MLIFLHGPDSYRREKKLRAFVAAYRAKHAGADLARFLLGSDKKASAEEGEAVRVFMRNRSLFDPARAAIVRIGSYSALSKEDVAWLRDVRDSSDAGLFVLADTTPTKACTFLIEKPSVVHEFPHLTGEALRAHVVGEAAARGVLLVGGDFDRLYALHGNDLWGIATELDVLALSGGSRHDIPRAKGGDFMGLVGLAAHGATRDRLPALFRLGEDGDPAKTFNMLSAFVAGEKKRLMADYDFAIKSGLLDYDLVLLDFALS